MDLFLAEHKKLWSRSSVRISVLLCVIYIVIFGGILQYQWLTLGSSKDVTGNHFDGYEYIRLRQEYAEKYGPVLTDDTLARMASDYQRAGKADNDEEIKKTDWSVISSWLQLLYPELQRPENYQLMLGYVDPSALTDLYGRRKAAIETYMDASGIEGSEKDYLLSMNEKTNTPFSYVWTEGWRTVLASMIPDFEIVIALALVISLAPLFAGEWHDRTGTMILSMKHGWKKDAVAKLAVGLVFTVEVFILISVPSIIVQMVFLGLSGWDTPIQCIKMLAIAPMNMAQAEIYEYLFLFVGIIGFATVVMLISSFLKSDRIAMIGGFAMLVVPMVVSGHLPYRAQLVLELFPLAGNAGDIFRMYTLNVFGKTIWLPYLELVTPLLCAMICIPISVKVWSRMQKN